MSNNAFRWLVLVLPLLLMPVISGADPPAPPTDVRAADTPDDAGHSITVSSKHYANDVPDELFDRAVGVGKSEAVQNAVQYPAASPRTGSQGPNPVTSQKAHKPSECEGLRVGATSCDEGEKWSRGESNPRAGTVSRSRLHA